MTSEEIHPSIISRMRPYLFSSASAVNIFLEIIIVANGLSVPYFLYGSSMTISIDLLPVTWITLLWIGSLYIIYVTEEVDSSRRSRLAHTFLNTAAIGSFLLILSFSLNLVGAQESTEFLNQLQLLSLLAGYVLSFAASSVALLLHMLRQKNIMILFLTFFFSLLVPFEIWSLIHWLAYPFDVVSYSGFAWRGASIELQLLFIAYPLIFWLTVAFLFSWVWLPFMKLAIGRARQRQEVKKSCLSGSQSEPKTFDEEPQKGTTSYFKSGNPAAPARRRLVPLIIVLTSLFLGALVAYYPYITPGLGFVGNDTHGYYLSLTDMASKSSLEALTSAVNTDKPLYMLFLYLLHILSTLSPTLVVEIVPIVTIALNSLAIYWLVQTVEKNAMTASLAALLSVFSFATTVSMYAGTLANWFEMAFGFIFLGLLLKSQEKMSPRLLFATALALIASLLTHYWSGILFLMIACCYWVILSAEHRRYSLKSLAILSILAATILVIMFSSNVATYFFSSFGYTESLNTVSSYTLFWSKLQALMDYWFLGAFANPVIIGLSLVGVAVSFHRRINFDRLLISWIIVATLVSVWVSPIGRSMDQWLVWRSLYLIPFAIFAALGLHFVISQLQALMRSQFAIQLGERGIHKTGFLSFFTNHEAPTVALFLMLDYLVSALLVLSNLPIMGVLLVLDLPVVAIIVYLSARKGANVTTLAFLFTMLIMLMMFNYALRTLAPLTVHRLQF